MSITTRPLTYDDLIQMPDDGNRYEIVGGELFVSPSPVPRHQELLGRPHVTLAAFLNERKLGKVYLAPLDVRLAEHDVVESSVLFANTGQLGIVARRPLTGHRIS